MTQISSKSLLITGGAGFIGSHFVELLVKLGHRVVVLDCLTYAGRRENVESIHDSHLAQLVVGSICDQEVVSQLLRENEIDLVVNFAAESHVDRSIEGPAPFIETNIKGTFSLLSASLDYWKNLPQSKKNSFRYLQVSTDEVYGSLGPTGQFSETSPYEPNSPYSASKAAGDHLVRAWFHTYGLPTLVTNCSNNYGPRQYPEKLIPTIIAAALQNKHLPVYGNGMNVRDWIHVQDHCQGIWLALEGGKVGSTYCFGGNAERNNLEVVQAICRHMDQFKPKHDRTLYESQIQFVTDRLGHDFRYAINDHKAQEELGFKRKYNFDQGLADTVRWYLENQDWCDSVKKTSRL